MERRWFPRLLAVVLALVILAGIGYGVFNLGFAQGLASKAAPAARQAGTPAPYYGWPLWFGGGPFWGFHLLGLFFGIFVLFAVLRLISFAFWGPRWGYWRHGHGGWDDEHDVPPRFREWHDRAHNKPAGTDRQA